MCVPILLCASSLTAAAQETAGTHAVVQTEQVDLKGLGKSIAKPVQRERILTIIPIPSDTPPQIFEEPDELGGGDKGSGPVIEDSPPTFTGSHVLELAVANVQSWIVSAYQIFLGAFLVFCGGWIARLRVRAKRAAQLVARERYVRFDGCLTDDFLRGRHD